MCTSWEKLCQHIRASCGQGITNELQSKPAVVAPKPAHMGTVLLRHAATEQMAGQGQACTQAAREQQVLALEAAQLAGDQEAPMKAATLTSKVAQASFDANEPVPAEMTGSEKAQCSNAWRACCKRSAQLARSRGQAFSLALGQHAQLLLQDRVKQGADWGAASTSFDPLQLCQLIEKMTLVQAEGQSPFAAAACNQEVGLCTLRQEAASSAQWHE